ncbi:MAG TPA: hypothetical protein VNX47_02365 [Nevskia sp.]|nr:hypothetical protein [Nevskia sp.]
MAVLHVHWPDELPAEELLGLLIGHAHRRGLCIEHDGAAGRLAIYSATVAGAAPAAHPKVVSLAAARPRRKNGAAVPACQGERR